MSDTYRKAERILYHHTETVKAWQALLLEYSDMKEHGDVHAQTYGDTHLSEGQVGDPAGSYVNTILKLERRISDLEARVRIIEDVRSCYEQSTDERDKIKHTVLQAFYLDGQSMRELSEELGMNYRTLYRRRRELVHDVIEKLERRSHEE